MKRAQQNTGRCARAESGRRRWSIGGRDVQTTQFERIE